MKQRVLYLLLVICLFTSTLFSQSISFSPQRGFFTASFNLSLSAPSGTSIRYTLDGSEPSLTNGFTYTAPIAVSTTTVVRAAAVSGSTLSPVMTHSYLFPAAVLQQPANIPGWPNNTYSLGNNASAVHDYEMDPEVVNDPAYSSQMIESLRDIPTLSIVMKKEDFLTMYDGESEFPASVEIINPKTPTANEQFNCGIESHSWLRLKRSMRLVLDNTYFPNRLRSNILKNAPNHGASAVDLFTKQKIVLRAGNNRSWARNWNPDRTVYTRDQWYRDAMIDVMGVGSHGTFMHLYVNGLYWGLYNPSERLDAGFEAAYMGGTFNDWLAFSEDGVRSGDATRFNYLINTLVNKDMTVAANYAEMKEYLDVENFCDYLLTTWYTGMTDWPGNNYSGGNRNNPPGPTKFYGWDCEWSWDVSRGTNNGAWVHPEFRNTVTNPTEIITKLWHQLRKNPDFMALFADRIYKHCFNDGPLTDARSLERWQKLTGFISKAILAESARWGDALGDGVTRTKNTHWQPEVDRVAGLMDGNVNRFLVALREQGYFPALNAPQFNREGGLVVGAFSFTMTNPNSGGQIYYTTNGADPRLSGGGIAPGAQVYSGAIAITGDITIKARVLNGSTWSTLHTADFTVPKVVINEFLASNSNTNKDEFGVAEDWIELYNAGDKPVDIGGMYITDNLATPTLYQIPTSSPATTTIPAKGYLLLWADGEPVQGPLHVLPKLSAGGEAIGLFAVVNGVTQQLDAYTFGAQTTDISLARSPNGTGDFVPFATPTPGAANVQLKKTGLYLNELVALNTTGLGDEAGEKNAWIEVYNKNDQPVNIGGLYLSTDPNNPGAFQVPANQAAATTIPAKGFLILWADNQTGQGPLHLGFTLNGQGGNLVLSEKIGTEFSVIDALSYGSQSANVAFGRYPDASVNFKSFTAPTPATSNILPAIAGVYINEFLASNNQGLTDENGEHDDWIELYNASGQPVDVGGLFITDNKANPGKWQFPTNQPGVTTIPAGGYKLVWADEQTAQGPLHVNIKLSADGEFIGLTQINGNEVKFLDSLSFGVQTSDITLGRIPNGTGPVQVLAQPSPGASNGAVAFTKVVYRINAGGTALATSMGAFRSDTLFTAATSKTYKNTKAINGTTDDALYQSERNSSSNNGTFSYNIPVASGEYKVVLHFAEIYFTAVGARKFDVSIEGKKVLDNYDIVAKAGAATAIQEAFTTSVTDGVLNIFFSATTADGGVNRPKVSALEILTTGGTVNQAPVASAGDDMTLTLPVNSVVLNGSGTDADGTIAQYQWAQVQGPNTAVITTAASAQPTVSGLVAGTYTFQLVVTDNSGAASIPDPVQVFVNPSTSGPTLSGLTLVNSLTNTDIGPLTNGYVINLAKTPNVNIRANVGGGTVQSVRFGLNTTTTFRLESTAPFALAGDSKGDYYNWAVTVGSYTVKATPYTATGGGGTAGPQISVNISVVNDPSLPAIISSNRNPEQDAPGLRLATYPNPARGSATLAFQVPKTTYLNVSLIDAGGRQVRQLFTGNADGGVLYRKQVGISGLARGVYFCRLLGADGRYQVSRMVIH